MTSADVITVDQHRTFVGVVEARNQHGERRFAATARPDDGHALAGFDVEVDPPQYRAALGVAEMDVAEADRALQRRQVDRPFGIDDGRSLVEQLEDPLNTSPCLLADGQQSRPAGGPEP